MSNDFMQRALTTTDPNVLSMSIALLQRAVQESADTADQSALLPNLANLYYAWTRLTGERAALDNAIAIWRILASGEPDVNDRAACYSNLCRNLTTLAENYGDDSVVDEAVVAGRRALELTNRGFESDHGTLKSNLASALHARFSAKGTVADIEESTQLFRGLRATTPPGHVMWTERAFGLAYALHAWHIATGARVLVPEAVEILQELNSEVPAEHWDRPRLLSSLGYFQFHLFVENGRVADLEMAASCHREAWLLTSRDQILWWLRLADVGRTAYALWSEKRDTMAMDEAAALFRQFLEAPSSFAREKREVSIALANLLLDRFAALGGKEDVDEAVAILEHLPAEGTVDSLEAYVVLSSLGKGYSAQGRCEDSASAYGKAAEATTVDSQRAAALTNQSVEYVKLHRVTERPEHQSSAVDASRGAVAVAPLSGSVRADIMVNLVAALNAAPTSEAEVVAETAGLMMEALRHTPAGSPKRVWRLDTLGVAIVRWLANATHIRHRMDAIEMFVELAGSLDARQLQDVSALPFMPLAMLRYYRAAGDASILTATISISRMLVSSAPEGTPGGSARLANLATALAEQANINSDNSARKEAIDLYGRALNSPSVSPLERATLLANQLGVAVNLMVDGGDPAVMDATFQAWLQAVADLPPDTPERFELFANAAGALAERSRSRQAASARTEWQVARLRKLLDSSGSGDADYASHAAALEAALNHQEALRIRDVAELDQAIDLHRMIVEASVSSGRAVSGAEVGFHLTNLGVALFDRYAATREATCLDEALPILRRAVAVSNLHPNQAGAMSGLARVLGEQFDIAGDAAALRESRHYYMLAAQVESAPAAVRADAALGWGYAAERMGDAESALRGLATSVGLLDEVAWRGMSRDDQQRMLQRYPRVTADAAAMAIDLDRVEYAVELLEQGRGVLVAQAVDHQNPYDRLLEEAPELAHELAHVIAQLSMAVQPPSDIHEGEGRHWLAGAVEYRTALATRRALLVEKVNEEYFDLFTPPRARDLLVAGDRGPVILINISEIRCDALTVTAEGVRLTPLPSVSARDVDAAAAVFLKALQNFQGQVGAARFEREGQVVTPLMLRATLTWLWEHIAEPILRDLGYTTQVPPDVPWPRVWWCPTGKLAFLPLHAACDMSPEAQRPGAVIDRVISGYTPTLRALLGARSRHVDPLPGDTSPLLVALPTTPKLKDLPAAGLELQECRALFPEATVLEGESATVAAVREALLAHPRVHLACHGSQDVNDSTGGKLHLYDGPLDARMIGALRIPRGDFAFLSACETFKGTLHLTDESLTVASAMQLAGYGSVIGTLWSIDDDLSVEITRDVYASLAQVDADAIWDPAAALHRSIRAMRARYPHAFNLWAPYVYVGR